MIDIGTWMKSRFIGQKLHFKCDCTAKLDVIGIIKDVEFGPETIFIVSVGNKLIKIGSNHPNLRVGKA